MDKQPQKEFLIPINKNLNALISQMTKTTGLSSVQILELALPVILALLNFVVEIIRILPRGHGYGRDEED